MVLNELHVLERRAGAVRQRHAVTILDSGVRGEGKHFAAAAGAEDDGARGDRLDASRLEVDGDHAFDAAIVHQEPGDEPLVIANDAGILEGSLEQRVEHVEAGLVRGKPRAHLFHAPEGAHGNPPVGLAAPRAAPVFEAEELLARFLYEGLDRILIAQPIAARNGVVGVLVEAVVRTDDTRRSTFGGDGVAAHRVHLGHDGDVEARIGFRDGNRGAQPRAAAADQHYIV